MLPPDTARLRFREVHPDDLSQLFRLQSDPVTMRFIRPPTDDLAVVEERMQQWAVYQAANPGLGVWNFETLENGAFAGYCVLRAVDWLPGNDLEVGYVIAPELWGRGLATEIAAALCRYGFAHFPVDKLVAFTDPANLASQRVLAKCGFARIGIEQNSYGESLRHEIKRPEAVQ